MNFIKHIERINKIHLLISTEKTGTPDDFAQTLHLSRRQLYNELETLKNLDASIKYCKKKESFYYDKPFELVFKYSLTTIVGEQTREIFGGSDFRASLLHGSILNLPNTNEVLEKHSL
jgi:hypothetical protein